MILKPCPYCHKDIPRSITACPYCHRDERGQAVVMDSAVSEASGPDRFFDGDLKELASDDLFVRDQAVIRVAQRGFGVVQALISILSDFAKPGLAGVATALGKIADRRAIPALAQAAKMGDEDLRLAAVWSLAQFHEPEVLPILLSEAEKPHFIVQSFLANALGTFQDSRVVPALTKLLQHPNREVAFQAAFALGETGNASSISALRSAWRRKDPLIRAATAASLRRLGSRPAWISVRMWILGCSALVLVGLGSGWFFYR